jgi:tripartite-type tricarboxylate transporter receptor subunit TctC
VLFDSVGTIVSTSGVEEIAPKTDEEWKNVGNNALIVAEAGNLLMMGERAKDRGDWMKAAAALTAAGVTALRAVEARNPAALLDAGGQLDAVCDQCHSKYWKEAPQE